MDLRCILVSMFFHLSHGFALYWSATMMMRHLVMSQKYWCIADAWLTMISDQANSCLEVITCSFKALAYCIPLTSCFGGHFVTHKSCHHHVLRSQTSAISLKFQIVKWKSSPDFSLTEKSPAQPLPLRKGLLPSSITPTISWPCHCSVMDLPCIGLQPWWRDIWLWVKSIDVL